MLTFLLACPFSLQQEHICVQGAFVHILLDPLQGKETQGCSGEQFQWPHHRGDPAENANSGTGQGEATLEHQAAPKQGIQSRDAPVMCQDSCLSSRKGSPGCSRFLGICGCMETTGCRNFGTQSKNKLSQGIKTNRFANKGRMGSTEETEEPRPCLLLCPRQDQVLSRG